VWGSYPPDTSGPTLWWANTTVFNTQIATYLCPSDGRQISGSLINYGGNMGGPFALGGFTGTMIPPTDPGWVYSDAQSLKLMPTAQGISFNSVTDGLSNTTMWSEAATPPPDPTQVKAGSGKNAENRVFFPLNVINTTPTV